MTAKELAAEIKTADPGLTAKMNLTYNNEKEHRAILSLDVDSITPMAIGLSDNIEETFSFNFDGELTYKDKKNSIINAKLQNFTFRNDKEERFVRNLHFCDNSKGHNPPAYIHGNCCNLRSKSGQEK